MKLFNGIRCAMYYVACSFRVQKIVCLSLDWIKYYNVDISCFSVTSEDWLTLAASL